MGELLKRDTAHHAQNVLERMKKIATGSDAGRPVRRLFGARCVARALFDSEWHYGRTRWITELCYELRQNLAHSNHNHSARIKFSLFHVAITRTIVLLTNAYQ